MIYGPTRSRRSPSQLVTMRVPMLPRISDVSDVTLCYDRRRQRLVFGKLHFSAPATCPPPLAPLYTATPRYHNCFLGLCMLQSVTTVHSYVSPKGIIFSCSSQLVSDLLLTVSLTAEMSFSARV